MNEEIFQTQKVQNIMSLHIPLTSCVLLQLMQLDPRHVNTFN